MDPYAFDEDAGYITSLERRQRKSADRADTHRFFGVITVAFISFSALLFCSELQAFMLKPEQALTGRVLVEIYRFLSGLLHLPLQLYDGLRDVAWTLNAVVYGPDFESQGLTVARGLVLVLSSLSLVFCGAMCGLLLVCGSAIEPSRRSEVLLSVVWLLLPVIIFRGWWHASCWLSLRPSTEAAMCLGCLSLLCTLCQAWQVHSELQRGMAAALLPADGWRRVLQLLVMGRSGSSHAVSVRGGRHNAHSKKKADGAGGHKRGSTAAIAAAAAGRGSKPAGSGQADGGKSVVAVAPTTPPPPHNPVAVTGSPGSGGGKAGRGGKGRDCCDATSPPGGSSVSHNHTAAPAKKPFVPPPHMQTSAEAEASPPDPAALPPSARAGSGGKKGHKKGSIGGGSSNNSSSSQQGLNLCASATTPPPRPSAAALKQLENQVERSGHSNSSSIASSTNSSYSRYGAGGSPLPTLPTPPHHVLHRNSNSSSCSSNNPLVPPPAVPPPSGKKPGSSIPTTAATATSRTPSSRPPLSNTATVTADPTKPLTSTSKSHTLSTAAATGNSLAALIASRNLASNNSNPIPVPPPPPKRSSVVSPAIGSFAAAAAAGVAKLKAAVTHVPTVTATATTATAAIAPLGNAKQPQAASAAAKPPPQPPPGPPPNHAKASKNAKQQHHQQQNTPPAQRNTAFQHTTSASGKASNGGPTSPFRTTPPVSPKPLNPAAPVFRYNPFNATATDPSQPTAPSDSPAASPVKPLSTHPRQLPQQQPLFYPLAEQLIAHKHASGDLDISSASANYSPFLDACPDPVAVTPAGNGFTPARQKGSLGSEGEFSFFSMPLPASNSPTPNPTALPASQQHSQQQHSHHPQHVQANTWTYSFPAIATPSPASRAYPAQPLSTQPLHAPPLTSNTTWQYDPLATGAANLVRPAQSLPPQPTSLRRPEDAQSAGTTLITRLIMAATAHKSPRATSASAGGAASADVQPLLPSPLASPQSAHSPFSSTHTSVGGAVSPLHSASPPMAPSAAFGRPPAANAGDFASHASAFGYGFDRYTQPTLALLQPPSASASDAASIKSPGDMLPGSLSDYGFVTDDDAVAPFALPAREDSGRSIDGNSGRVDEAGSLCTICWVRPRRVGFLHGTTSHLCVCRTCAATMREGIDRCVLCRATIERIIDVY